MTVETAECPIDSAELPPRALRHYRHFAWVVHEQRLMLLVLAALCAGCAMIWGIALRLRNKPPVVVRAPVSLKEEAAGYFGVHEVSYDQLAFFLNGCLPLLYAADPTGHALLPLAQGLVAPDIYTEAEARLDGQEAKIRKNGMTQSLNLTGITGVVADAASGRAAADAEGFLLVTIRGSAAELFPWKARVLVEANPASRLNPYPFFLLRLDPRTAPE